MVFIFQFVNVMYHIDWFADVGWGGGGKGDWEGEHM